MLAACADSVSVGGHHRTSGTELEAEHTTGFSSLIIEAARRRTRIVPELLGRGVDPAARPIERAAANEIPEAPGIPRSRSCWQARASSVVEFCCLDDSLGLFDEYEPVGRHVLERLASPVRPADSQCVRSIAFPQPEVKP